MAKPLDFGFASYHFGGVSHSWTHPDISSYRYFLFEGQHFFSTSPDEKCCGKYTKKGERRDAICCETYCPSGRRNVSDFHHPWLTVPAHKVGYFCRLFVQKAFSLYILV